MEKREVLCYTSKTMEQKRGDKEDEDRHTVKKVYSIL